MNDLEDWLVEQARALGLDALRIGAADPGLLREFCGRVLTELAARGRLAGPETPGCHVIRRQETN